MNNYPLLIEIGYENLPPEDVSIIEKNAKQNFTAILNEKRIKFKDINIFVSVRRLTVVVKEIASHQTPLSMKVKGPPYSIACDDTGTPTKAGYGFAAKMGVDFKELITEDGYLFHLVLQSGEAVRGMLVELLSEFLKSFDFPMTMRWPGYEVQFPRPLRWLLTKMGNNFINFKLGALKSRRTSRGHYLFADKKISIDDVHDYEKILKRNYVIVDAVQRRQSVKKAIERTLKYTSGCAVISNKLLEEVSNSLEFPTGVRGKFDKKYLRMPREIIEACLMYHQRFFPVEDSEGNIINNFVGVRDGISENLDLIRQGYEKVLVARLEDAEFFLAKDRTVHLEEHLKKLKGIQFRRNLGTLYNKVVRCEKLTKYIGSEINKKDEFIKTAMRIAHLSKADLATQMVEEFPELEGIVGRIYALNDGEKLPVAEGISQQYQPRTGEDSIPDLDEAAVVSVADRIDTLTGNIKSGVEVTGSEDPFALRRTVRGMLRILVEKKWDIDIALLIKKSVQLYSEQEINFKNDNKVEEFIFSQIMQYAKENFDYDVVECVIKESELNPYITFKKAKAIEKIKHSKGFDSLITAFKRTRNILKQAEEKNISIPEKYDVRLLKEEAEKNLSRKYSAALLDVRKKLKAKDFYGGLKILASLRGAVDKFFDDVLVMAPEKKLMKNRLAMLKNIVELFSPAGDISKLKIG